LGAVVDAGKPVVVRNSDIMRLTQTSEAEFQAICDRERAEIERRRKIFIGSRAPLDPQDRVVIVIDDGIATGATMRAALRATRMRRPKRLVLAVPVAPARTLEALRAEADDIVCLATPEPFHAVGFSYADFRQLSDEDVSEILAEVEKTAEGVVRR
jgi:putative phosphoribosyl transferase